MPATKGVLSKKLQKCDPRCEKHDDELVSPRVYGACKRRLDLEQHELKAKVIASSNSTHLSPGSHDNHAILLSTDFTAAVPSAVPNSNLLDLGPVIVDPWDDTTLPVLGGSMEPDLLDDSVDYWGDIDDNGADPPSRTPTPTPVDSYGNMGGLIPFDSPRLFDSSPSAFSIEDNSELFPPSDFELDPWADAVEDGITNMNSPADNARGAYIISLSWPLPAPVGCINIAWS